jgi:hypothetical protein
MFFTSLRPLPSRKLLLLSLLSAPALLAQTQTGINGTVTDASGAVISNCQVEVRDVATGVVTTAQTSSAGTYTFPNLLPGTYTVTFTETGFTTSAHSGVTVETGRSSNVNGTLTTGEVSQTVDVKSSAISLQTSTPQVGVTIENKVVEELPDELSGQARQVDNFIFLAPGVTGSSFSHRISGGEDFQNEVLFQGIPAVQSETEGFQTYINPPFEMVNEFHVSSSVFSTQYGLGQGAVNYGFVSGTNRLHGDAFYINRNNYFDARGLVEINPHVPVNKENNYGFSVGGPVYIPHLYNGRNRTFWHATDEYFKYNQQPATTMTVPTALAKQGNFSGYPQLYAPQGVNCPGLTPGQPIPNNVIPQSCFSRLSTSLLSAIPDPNLPGVVNNINSQLGVVTTNQTSWGYTLDHNINDRHSLHFSQWHDAQNSPAIDNNAYFANELSGLKTEPRLGSGFFLSYTGSVSPNLVITAGLGWLGELNNEENAHQNVNFPGIANGTVLPTITFGGLAPDALTTWGAGGHGEISSINRKLGIAFQNNYLYTHGRNTYNFGFETRRAYQDDHEQNSADGSFAFSSLTTSNGVTDQTATANENTTGNAFASFLLGQVDNTYRQQAFETRLRNYSISPYIMDDIKATPNLTINAGIRWDILVPFTADQPGNIVFLDVTKPNPGAIGPNGPLLGAATSLGHGTDAAGFTRDNIPWKNVGPRLGFAYALNPKTVLSGGYAVTFLDGGAYEFGTNKTANNYGNVLAGINQTNSSGTTVANYGSWDARTLPSPPNTPLTAALGNGSGVLHPFQKSGISQPYSQMFDLGIQRELPWNLFTAITYVGNHGVHLPSTLNNTNQLDPRFLSLGPSLLETWSSPAGQAALKGAGVPNIGGLYQPYANFGNDFPGQLVQQALLEFPQFLGTENGNTLNNFETSGVSIYSALQAQLQKRFTDGLSFLLSYTFSRTMSNSDHGFSTGSPDALNKFNQRAEWAVSTGDQPHVLVLSGVYELPFGAGKPFLSGGNSFISREVIGGWQVSGIFEYQSGQPFGITASGTPLATGGNRANVVPGAPIHLNFKNYYNGTPVLNTAAYTDPGRTAVGDAARNQSNLRNPFQSTENVSLAKKFSFSEGVQAELRMEYFNILNRMQVCGPTNNGGNVDMNISNLRTASNPNANFGYVVGPCQANTPRQGQAYFRVSF